MRKQHKKVINVLFFVLPIILAVICLAFVVMRDNQSGMPTPHSLMFSGEYSYNGEEWYPLNAESEIPAQKGKLMIRGHFDKDILEGARLNIYCNHIGVSAFVNGERIYVDTPFEIENIGIKLMPSMCGKRWEHILCPDIGTEDIVEFHFVNHHSRGNKNAYKEFLSVMYVTPNVNDVLDSYLNSYIKPFQALGGGVLILAIMLLGAAFAAVLLKSSIAGRFFKMGLVTLFVGGYMILDIMQVHLLDELMVIKTYGSQLCIILAVYFLSLLVSDIFEGKKRRITNYILGFSAVVNTLIIAVAITGKLLIFDMQMYWIALQLVICPFLLGGCIQELRRAKREKRMEHICAILLLSSLLLDFAGVGSTIYHQGVCFKFTFLLIVILYLIIGVKHIIQEHHATLKNEKLQKELESSRIALMLSQIQPHFLYNVIGTIRGLCRKDAEQAWIALGDFSSYLRGNLNALSNTEMIHFSSELRHIEAYLRLEKMRMGEELSITYDIQQKDFFVPPLTIQPLVENAVKHGVFHKEGGGTVSICTRSDGAYIYVVIEDDGVGFDVNASLEYDERYTHIGLENVRNRIEKMLEGKLVIDTVNGQGTKVTVILPQK